MSGKELHSMTAKMFRQFEGLKDEALVEFLQNFVYRTGHLDYPIDSWRIKEEHFRVLPNHIRMVSADFEEIFPAVLGMGIIRPIGVRKGNLPVLDKNGVLAFVAATHLLNHELPDFKRTEWRETVESWREDNLGGHPLANSLYEPYKRGMTLADFLKRFDKKLPMSRKTDSQPNVEKPVETTKTELVRDDLRRNQPLSERLVMTRKVS